jgi:hypothetical protein
LKCQKYRAVFAYCSGNQYEFAASAIR